MGCSRPLCEGFEDSNRKAGGTQSLDELDAELSSVGLGPNVVPPAVQPQTYAYSPRPGGGSNCTDTPGRLGATVPGGSTTNAVTTTGALRATDIPGTIRKSSGIVVAPDR